jgi:hypothetical protein
MSQHGCAVPRIGKPAYQRAARSRATRRDRRPLGPILVVVVTPVGMVVAANGTTDAARATAKPAQQPATSNAAAPTPAAATPSPSPKATAAATPRVAPVESHSVGADWAWTAIPLTWVGVSLALAVLLIFVGRIINPLAKYVWRRDPPMRPVAGVDVVTAVNLGRLVSDEHRREATGNAQRVWDAAPDKPRLGMTTAVAQPGQNPVRLDRARNELREYFESAYAAMLRSQLRGLLALSRRNTNAVGDLLVYHSDCLQRGAAIGFSDWLDYLDRNGFVDLSQANPNEVVSAVSITTLGRVFLGWCDSKGYSPETLGASGRPF